jgi:hypothetical protein
VLSPTGYSWNVGRSNGDGSAQRLLAGARDRGVALSCTVLLADTNGTAAWESAGIGFFSLIGKSPRR